MHSLTYEISFYFPFIVPIASPSACSKLRCQLAFLWPASSSSRSEWKSHWKWRTNGPWTSSLWLHGNKQLRSLINRARRVAARTAFEWNVVPAPHPPSARKKEENFWSCFHFPVKEGKKAPRFVASHERCRIAGGRPGLGKVTHYTKVGEEENKAWHELALHFILSPYLIIIG